MTKKTGRSLSSRRHSRNRGRIPYAPVVLGVLIACMGLSSGVTGPIDKALHLSFLGAAANAVEAKPAEPSSAPPVMVGPSITATKSHSPAGPFHLGDTITYSTT